jgi:predicted MFS family arabinose efflux permease
VNTWSGRQLWTLLLLFLVLTSNYIDRALLGILQEAVKADLGFSDTQLGLVSGPAFALFYALAGLPTARFAEGRNRARVLSGLIAIWSGMTMLCGLALNFVQLALSRAGVALGEGGCVPISHALMAERFAFRQRGRAMSVLASSSAVAAIIGPLLGAAVAEAYGWRAAFLCVGLPGLALALLVYLTLAPQAAGAPDPAGPRRHALRHDIATLFRNRAFVGIFVGSAFLATANAGITFFAAPYLLRTYDLSLTEVSTIYAVAIGGAGFCGTFLSGYLADRWAGERGRSFVLIPAAGAAIASVTLITAFTRDTWWVAAVLLLFGHVALDCKSPSMAAVQNISPPHMRATSAAVLMLAVTAFGTGLGPLFVGAISDLVAARSFPATLGAFTELCRPGVESEYPAACRTALATGVRGGLVIVCSLLLAASAGMYYASRHIDRPHG